MRAEITGNLTEDPELRFTPSGVAYARMRVAENHRFRKGDGEWQESTSFHTVVAWRDLAENASTSLRKGMRIIVIGKQEDRSFNTEAGEKRTVKEITADEIGPSLRWATADVTKTDRGGQGGGGGGGGGYSAPQAPPAARHEPQPTVGGGDDFDPYNSDEEPF